MLRNAIFLWTGLLCIACATGSSVPTGGTGASGGTGGAPVQSSGGGESDGNGGSVGGQPGVGGEGGSAPCLEDPCKLVVPQCGCDVGDKCTIDNQAERACVADDGSTEVGTDCGAGNDCAAGAICLGSASVGYCAEFCAMDAECEANICSVLLNDGSGGTIPDVKLCSSSCDPGNAGGCPAGLGCALGQEADGQMRFFFLCFAAGTGMAGAACTSAASCAPGFGCYNNGTADVCFRNCNVNAPNCPGQACLALNDQNMAPIFVGSYAMGVCN